MGALSTADLAMFDRFRVPRDLLESAGIIRVTDREARDRLAVTLTGDLSGILFPGLHPKTGLPRNFRVRRDHHEIEDDKPKNKYVSSRDRQSLYFAPGVASLLADASVPVVVAEAEKSCLALTALGQRAKRSWLAIATRGCWGFRGRIGRTIDASGKPVDETGVVTDFDLVEWTDRDVVLLPDSNVAVNESVRNATRALASELSRRGARVRIAHLPSDQGINGPDDFIAMHSDGELFALVDSAQPAAAPRRAKQTRAKPKQGRGVHLEDPDPWHEPVDGAQLLDDVATLFERYLALPPFASTVLALWVLHAYALVAAFTSPILGVTSPGEAMWKDAALDCARCRGASSALRLECHARGAVSNYRAIHTDTTD
jgi:hypothetical protein